MNRRFRWRRALHLAALAALVCGSGLTPAIAETPLDALKGGGAIALIRHASAPGTGDPSGFRLGDCASQRNLGPAGQAEATALGSRLRQAGVRITGVRSSRWCRAAETARLAFPDLVATPDEALDSFFDERGRGPAQSAAVKRLVFGHDGQAGTLVLVTHQVNITALTGIVPREGEIVVVRPGVGGELEVVGRLNP